MIPIQEMISYPVFAANGQKIQPDTAKYSAGFQQSDVLPAEWVNFFENKASSAITTLNAGVTSMEEELTAVVEAGGQTPSAKDNTQLLKAIQYMINRAVASSALASYPIGSYYISENPTDPEILFGGKWTQVKDRFILAAGDRYPLTEETKHGGADTDDMYGQIKLTESNLPAHAHNMEHKHTTDSKGNHTHTWIPSVGDGGNPDGGGDSMSSSYYVRYGKNTTQYHSTWLNYTGNHSHETNSLKNASGTNITDTSTVGSSESFSILPPYEVAYCWKRVA